MKLLLKIRSVLQKKFIKILILKTEKENENHKTVHMSFEIFQPKWNEPRQEVTLLILIVINNVDWVTINRFRRCLTGLKILFEHGLNPIFQVYITAKRELVLKDQNV